MLEAIGIVLGTLVVLFVLFVAFGVFLKWVHDKHEYRVAQAATRTSFAERAEAITAYMDAHPGVTRDEAALATRITKT